MLRPSVRYRLASTRTEAQSCLSAYEQVRILSNKITTHIWFTFGRKQTVIQYHGELSAW